ncbi:hypothetical protein BJ165DRAFT_1480936 [Panaeolus papilionaceus]|nr:hypothetical protein BJ165DRAFT_1480936 [Panaeolus papilionaceus]
MVAPVVKVQCPQNHSIALVDNAIPFTSILWMTSDVVISIDFSSIAFGAMDAGAIAIYPSLMGDLDTGLMLRDTTPFPLAPGVNYFATISVKGRRAFDNRAQVASTFGILDSTKDYIVPSIGFAIPDTLARGKLGLSFNISSLRLSGVFDTTEFRAEIDQRDKTVFAGLATVGGFFTFLSGVFAFIFGTTLLRILFDIRELSIFGIAQKRDRKKIVKAYLDAYPSLRAELELEASQRGAVAILQDHLLDMKLFQEVLDAERREGSMEMATRVKDEEQAARQKNEGHGIQGSEATFINESEEANLLVPAGPSKTVDRTISMKRPD